ncbi:glutathione S-transferase [Cognatishimia maritima]|uniref:Glutathione S-transferase n=1 Tax=Cognatishimia maritima TaxID=870908 RepID=A0A1M5NVZ9_9RHOB|nr:glutathione S-transferase [Cognatishimia maritima]SHG93756.1 glutathione S-transferase [Cognatishimia maritima]
MKYDTSQYETVSLKLLTSPASPYSRKVKVLLHETGLIDALDLVAVNTKPTAVDPQLQSANPLGKIPCLIRDNAPALYDSRVICRFLDQQAGGNFYPDEKLWDVLIVEATAEGILDSALSMVYERRFRPEPLQSNAWISAQWQKIKGALQALDTDWMTELNAPTHMGHIAVGCALGYLDFRLDAQNWRAGHSSLAAWYDAFKLRPSMQATAPKDT